MVHTKFRGSRPTGSAEDFWRVFTIYRRGGHLGHVPRMPRTNILSLYPWRLHTKFGFDWPSGFGEDVWNCGWRMDGRTPDYGYTIYLAIQSQKRCFFSFCWHFLVEYSTYANIFPLTCAQTHTGGCQVCKCYWVSESGQRSTKYKIPKTSIFSDLTLEKTAKHTFCEFLMRFRANENVMHDDYWRQRSIECTYLKMI